MPKRVRHDKEGNGGVKTYYVYILASKPHGTLYIGVTSDLIRRIYEHRTDAVDGFTRKYAVHRLVYFEMGNDIESAILREKQLKNWHRDWKINLIERDNPQWDDLYPALIGEMDAETSSA
ncbi:MAG: GIY-YIG nuclease family protein [Alphaproteobacteria bacterium]|nr:GIY-YIG nuclease family protein [Alphaproteobacteria bacterium]